MDRLVTRNIFPVRQGDAIENLFEEQHRLATDIGTINDRNLGRIEALDSPAKVGNARINQGSSL
ncbi:hypothetical protein KAR29_07120 [Aminithiophilus ramosus]|uniref:Uncharacterized protein n=2 Tax=Synergistales TaxID=649776 RepID=A0A9Q7A487_9BACT|nr:hypothetical protein [Aminithiophilus ramosus]QTX31186.1 hypothetical protein KAR29_07120 [Aminithiophilus ramosus]QVL37465.1 hypothetical protein KIH16_06975 [Synergistota bacterium]